VQEDPHALSLPLELARQCRKSLNSKAMPFNALLSLPKLPTLACLGQPCDADLKQTKDPGKVTT
jgi:hypothetical protein